MITTRPPEVAVLDLRELAGELPPIAGPLVVIDDAVSLLAHAPIYFRLLEDPQVHGLICVAVGQVDRATATQDGAVLAVPGVLPQGARAILWVGDEHGVLWSKETERPRPAQPTVPSAVQRLVDLLRLPEVFEQVGAIVEEYQDRAASPGYQLMSGAAEPGELAEARATVLRRLTEFLPNAALPPPLADPANFAAEQVPAAFVPTGPVGAAMSGAEKLLSDVEEKAAKIGGWLGLFGRERAGQVLGGRLVEAADAVERSRQKLLELLTGMDGHLRVGRPEVRDVVDLGVSAPTHVRTEQVAGAVQDLVRKAIGPRRSLPTLAAQMRQAAASAEPQGCARAVNELNQGREIGRQVPVFRLWPLWLWTAPLIVLTCLVAAAAPPIAWVGYLLGGVFALTWFLAGWLLLARRPGANGELEWADTVLRALAGYGVPGLVGAGGGIALANYVRSVVPLAIWLPPRVAWISIILAAVLMLTTVSLAWPSAARRWVKAMSLPALRADFDRMTTIAELAIKDEWLPAERRRVVAAALTEVANGLDEIAEVFTKKIGERPPNAATNGSRPSGVPGVLRQELIEVIGTDLVAFTHDVLELAWPAIRQGHRRPAESYKQIAEDRYRDYHSHLAAAGLLTAPAFATDTGPRDRLVLRQWAEAADALAPMRAQLTDEMNQLCRASQLAVIDREADGRILRFAPQPVQRVLEADRVRNRSLLAERPIWTASGELAGSLRLLPLRWGAIEQRRGRRA